MCGVVWLGLMGLLSELFVVGGFRLFCFLLY